MQWDRAGSLVGDSPKGSGSSLGARREITGRRPDDMPQECQRSPSSYQGKPTSMRLEGWLRFAVDGSNRFGVVTTRSAQEQSYGKVLFGLQFTLLFGLTVEIKSGI
ncbi:hypothetical protein BHE74_00020979 [Ensete ventricosum]|nr:hypothetical protein BHE74_00020979 [Ensete ventricosum]